MFSRIVGIIPSPKSRPPRLKAKITIVIVKNMLFIPPRFISEAMFSGTPSLLNPLYKIFAISPRLYPVLNWAITRLSALTIIMLTIAGSLNIESTIKSTNGIKAYP